VRCPDETTFHRVLTSVEPALLERALLAWQEQVLGPSADPAIVFDGKKLRHAQGELVSAIGAQSGRWLGTVSTEQKSNEIPAARALLQKVEVAGQTVLADALHMQIETAPQLLFEHGADCVFPVKGNQKTPRTRSLRREVNRGCREIRALESQATTPEATGVPGAQQIARRRRRVRRAGKSSTETVCLIGSRPPPTLPAQELAELERAYWTIESALHYRLDEVLDEDRRRVRTPRAAHVPGMFRASPSASLAQRKRTRQRTSTRDFHDHLRAANARRAHRLVTAAAPTSWRP
jgi:predicted transposase YbfD/YdcC